LPESLSIFATACEKGVRARTGEERFEFAWLENAINAGLQTLDLTFPMDFEFQQFDAEVVDIYSLPRDIAETIPQFRQVYLWDRKPVYPQLATASPPTGSSHRC
jgi:hypothetical protein